MKETIKSIIAKLGAMPELNSADEDWGQLDYYSNNFPVKFPCALVDVSNANFSNIGMDKNASPQNRQLAETTISLTIANVKLTNTAFRAPEAQKDTAFSIWDLLEAIHVQLHGWHPTDTSGKLIRMGHQRIKRDDGVQEYTLIYSLGINNV